MLFRPTVYGYTASPALRRLGKALDFPQAAAHDKYNGLQ